MQTLSAWFKALSEDIRLQILAFIFRYGEICGCELEHFLDVSQSKVSRHLRYLLNAGLLEDRRDGLWVYYRIADPDDDSRKMLLATLRVLLADLPLPDIGSDLATLRTARCGPRSAGVPAVDRVAGRPSHRGTKGDLGSQKAGRKRQTVRS